MVMIGLYDPTRLLLTLLGNMQTPTLRNDSSLEMLRVLIQQLVHFKVVYKQWSR